MKLFGPEGSARLAYGSIGRTAVEAVLALTTGLLLARFAWVMVSPGDAAPPLSSHASASVPETSNSQSVLSLLTQTDPFLAAPADLTQAAIPTSLNLKIAGLRWSDGKVGSSSAILILPDNSQKRVSAGEQIISGAILESVAADRVFLRFNGQLQELLLNDPNKPLFAAGAADYPSSSTPPAAQPPQAEQPGATPETVTPALLLTDVDMQPEYRNGAVTGYRLSPRGQGHFQTAGLEVGDLVLRVNGNSIEGMEPAAIQSAVMSSDSIALDVVRQGAIIRLRLSPESGLSQ